MTSPEELLFENELLKKQVKSLAGERDQIAERCEALGSAGRAADKRVFALERQLESERHVADGDIKELKAEVHRLKGDVHGEMALREATEAKLAAVTTERDQLSIELRAALDRISEQGDALLDLARDL